MVNSCAHPEEKKKQLTAEHTQKEIQYTDMKKNSQSCKY